MKVENVIYREKREWIKKYMLEKIRQDDGAYAQKTMENF